MSHMSTIELEVKDIDILSQACNRMGLKLIRDQKTHKWFGSKDGVCDHAISIPEAEYEIGVTKKNGQYELNCDFYDRRLTQAIGENGGRLKQSYAIEKTRQAARMRGYSVTERMNESKVQLRISIS